MIIGGWYVRLAAIIMALVSVSVHLFKLYSSVHFNWVLNKLEWLMIPALWALLSEVMKGLTSKVCVCVFCFMFA